MGDTDSNSHSGSEEPSLPDLFALLSVSNKTLELTTRTPTAKPKPKLDPVSIGRNRAAYLVDEDDSEDSDLDSPLLPLLLPFQLRQQRCTALEEPADSARGRKGTQKKRSWEPPRMILIDSEVTEIVPDPASAERSFLPTRDGTIEGEPSFSVRDYKLPDEAPLSSELRLPTPSKPNPRIPQTPSRPQRHSFWHQGTVDDWNTQHSPAKLPNPFTMARSPRTKEKKQRGSKVESPRKQAQAKKSERQAFIDRREGIAKEFATELDNKLAEGKLGRMTAERGGIEIVWSKTLRSTAGQCRASWTDASQTHAKVLISLADKVITDDHSVRDTVAHEVCHALKKLVSRDKGSAHGSCFHAWMLRAQAEFPEHHISVSRCHSIEIEYSHVWRCETCGRQYRRHSRSINTETQRCGGGCRGRLAQIKPVPKVATAKGEAYRAFCKRRGAEIRAAAKAESGSGKVGLTLGEVQRVCAREWREKALEEARIELGTLSLAGGGGGRGSRGGGRCG